MQFYTIFVYFVWLMAIYFNVTLLVILFSKKDELFESPEELKESELPKVSIIVPAYNEEEGIADCIESLRNIDYPQHLLEIIVINDGSTDNTSKIVNKLKGGNVRFIDNKDNKGKANCLNEGIALATGELVACMDADSYVQPDILRKTAPYFKDKEVGATIVRVKVRNPKTLLEKVVEIEYILGLALSLKALSFLDSVHVTPGPFSIYRKSVMDEIGGFDPNNMTEDLEIAHRIQKSDHKIASCLSTYVDTTIPPTLKGLYKQRKRWYTGAIITLLQHRDMIFRRKFGMFGFFFPFNYALIFTGLAIFFSSTYIFFSKSFYNFKLYSLTNFNMLSGLSFSNIDFLKLNIFVFMAVSAIASIFILTYCGLRLTGTDLKTRKLPFISYWSIFFFYQIVWCVSLFSVIFRRDVKWR